MLLYYTLYLAGEINMVDNSNPTMGQTIQGIPSSAGQQPNMPAGNPLAKHLRQPKIYIKLPSGGKYWPEGSIEMPESGEFAVYAMTAKDEITFKTPDALLNGQATVDVIQSCMPGIKDAWQMPSIDTDAILVAIRMASFGEALDMKGKVPNTDIEREFQINLQNLLDKYTGTTYTDTFQIEGFKVQIQPVTYKTVTQQSVKAFEEQRIFTIINDDNANPTEKLAKFQKSFKNLTEINMGIVIESVVAIQPDGETEAVTHRAHLREFLENADAKVYNQIMDHITSQKNMFTQAPLKIEATEEELAAGAPTTYEMPIQFDQSNFFG